MLGLGYGVVPHVVGDLPVACDEKRKRREPRWRSRLIFVLAAYLPHPEQDAQQSAEGQHEAFAAFTAAVRPNATTASNRIALILFMAFSFLEMKELLSTDSLLSVREGANCVGRF